MELYQFSSPRQVSNLLQSSVAVFQFVTTVLVLALLACSQSLYLLLLSSQTCPVSDEENVLLQKRQNSSSKS